LKGINIKLQRYKKWMEKSNATFGNKWQ
jgi:hypothetical protein